jgi:hypothetical protein
MFSFMCMFCRSLFILLYFLAIVLSVLLYTDSNYPFENVQKDKRRSIKHTHKTDDRVTRNPLKSGGEPRCSGRVAIPALLVARDDKS